MGPALRVGPFQELKQVLLWQVFLVPPQAV
jgi:hypothetical protein